MQRGFDRAEIIRIRGKDREPRPTDAVHVNMGLVSARTAWWDIPLPPCPDCGGELVWDEAGHVPGTRLCMGCGSLFSVQTEHVASFTHPELDGTWNRILPDGTLELRDPNDGQIADPADKHRHQFRVVDGAPCTRRLPCEKFGDCWRDETEPPAWRPIKKWPTWELITEYFRHHGIDPLKPAISSGRAE
jgi:hypothetical protein